MYEKRNKIIRYFWFKASKDEYSSIFVRFNIIRYFEIIKTSSPIYEGYALYHIKSSFLSYDKVHINLNSLKQINVNAYVNR